MIINDNPRDWVVFFGICALIVIVGLILAVHPDLFITQLRKSLQRYAKANNLIDTKIDRMILPGIRSWYGGSLNDFVRNDDRHPESYPRLITYIRWFGISMVTFVVGMNLLGLLITIIVWLSPSASICLSSHPNCVP